MSDAEKPSDDLVNGLTDRLDGVQSLVSFTGQSESLGAYREAIRFFENAFALPVNALEKKLAHFLASGAFGYTRDEVSEWFRYRDGSVHGDGRETTTLVWDADIVRFMNRIEQAMLDVLFNKQEWHSSSRERRMLWRARAGTLDNQGNVFMTQGAAATVTNSWFDGFQSYPHDLSASISQRPVEWWAKFLSDLSGAADSNAATVSLDDTARLTHGRLTILPKPTD